MPDFLLPDLGEGLEGAEVVGWRVAVGDVVVVDQIVADVETAKAVVEVPIPFGGTISTLHAEPGATVKVGDPLISVTAEDREGSGNVLIGYGTGGAEGRRRQRRRPVRPQPAHAAAPPEARPAEDARTGPVPVVSPLVRRMARDAGIDLTTVAGSGPSGVVRRSDVEDASSRRTPRVAEDRPGEIRIPLRGLRKTVADKLTRSRREIPEATVWVDVDATDLLAARVALNARNPEQPIGLLSLLARFTVLAVRRYPELNARVEADEIVVADHVHLGFAAQTERGLVVPVVRDAHTLSTRDLSAALAERTAAARAGTLTPSDMSGGTITVNNYGVFGVDGSAAIINHPEAAIIGMGRIIDRPWVVDGQLVVRKVSQLTLAFDHRVCDGGTAGGFLRYLADCVESPITALGDL